MWPARLEKTRKLEYSPQNIAKQTQGEINKTKSQTESESDPRKSESEEESEEDRAYK